MGGHQPHIVVTDFQQADMENVRIPNRHRLGETNGAADGVGFLGVNARPGLTKTVFKCGGKGGGLIESCGIFFAATVFAATQTEYADQSQQQEGEESQHQNVLVQPPVTGGKKAISSPGFNGWSILTIS